MDAGLAPYEAYIKLPTGEVSRLGKSLGWNVAPCATSPDDLYTVVRCCGRIFWYRWRDYRRGWGWTPASGTHEQMARVAFDFTNARRVDSVEPLITVGWPKRRTKNEPRLASLAVTVGDNRLNTQID